MKLTAFIYVLIIILLAPASCSKTGDSLPSPPPDPCSLINISINGTVINPSAMGASDGSITVAAAGGSGFTFNLNGGSFQSHNKFYNLAAGNYTVVVRNSDGCTGSIS